MSEWFDVVDEDDCVISRAKRSDCHGNPKLIHRAVHVLVFNDAGDLLLQKRLLSKDIQPGKWDSSVGGHLDEGEGYRAAALREMVEELGIAGAPLTFLYKSTIRNSIESENIETYLCGYSGEINYAPDEISEVRFWTAEEIDKALGTGLFTPNFEDEWAMFQDFVGKYQTQASRSINFCGGDSFPAIMTALINEG
ncbi:MAG: NUDIX domain-containing protein [Desulfuromonadales bacterium]|nr:NUDIX domain-containing protein [Desulfuromonadales bacterium]